VEERKVKEKKRREGVMFMTNDCYDANHNIIQCVLQRMKESELSLYSDVVAVAGECRE
jgi:hypothetical protein